MSKIGKALKALWWIIRKPALLNKVLTDGESWQIFIQKKYGLTGGLPVIELDRLIKNKSISLGPMTFLDGGSLPTDMMLLASLAEGIKDCHYFEIGTWRGESVAAIASRASSCFSLCLTDDEMRALGMHEKSIESHMMFSKDLENVTQLRGDSRTFDFASVKKKFDLVFIDGNHHYDCIISDTRSVFKHLVKEDGIVVWHDYGFHPDQVRFEVMAAILEGVGPDRAGKVYHVAHTKCAIYTGHTLQSSQVEFPVIPSEYYNLSITREKL